MPGIVAVCAIDFRARLMDAQISQPLRSRQTGTRFLHLAGGSNTVYAMSAKFSSTPRFLEDVLRRSLSWNVSIAILDYVATGLIAPKIDIYQALNAASY